MKRKIVCCVLCLLMLTGLSACQSVKTKVCYTVYPIGYILDRVTGQKIETVSIQNEDSIQIAQINENYEEELKEAGVFVYLGQLEPYLTIYNDSIESMQIDFLDLSINNSFSRFQRYTRVAKEGQESFIESPYYSSSLFDSVDVNEMDLALWMNPVSMLSMAKEITEWLIKKSPENEAYFQERYEALQADLILLDSEFETLSRKLIAEKKEIKFVSMTSCFGNWQSYGIQVYPVILSKYGVLPTEAQLEVIINRIIEDDVKYIAYEPNLDEVSRALYERIKDELGLVEVNLSNVSSLSGSEKEAGADYLSIMYQNLDILESMMNDQIEENKSEPPVETEEES